MQTHPVHRLPLVALCIALVACVGREAPVVHDSANAISRAKAAAASRERAPVLPSLDTLPTPGEGLAFAGDWTPTVNYRDSLFTIERPESSTVESRPAAPSYGRPHRDVVLARLPGCKWSCVLTVEVWPDSAGGGMATMVHDLTSPDTTEGSLDGEDGAARILDSLPLGPDAAVHLESNCGDCSARVILTSRRGWMAKIEYSLDDREQYSPSLIGHLATIARSFRWRR